MTSSGGKFAYWAFICHSPHDGQWVEWLSRSLRLFRIDARFRAGLPAGAPSVERLSPVFVDPTPYAPGRHLDEVAHHALLQSLFLIVVASPHAARSARVACAIDAFRAGRSSRHILTFVVGGRPNAAQRGYSPDEECFPEGLRSEEAGSVSMEPLAADARSRAGGRESALLRLVAGLIGADYALLRAQRRRRQWLGAAMISGAMAICVAAGGAWLARARPNPWIGVWDGKTWSTCDYYSGPVSVRMMGAGPGTIREYVYIEPGHQFAGAMLLRFSGNVARGSHGLTLTLKGDTVTVTNPDTCQNATERRRR